MSKFLMRCAVAAMVFGPAASAAEPIKLKLSFYTSDRASVYHAAVKPFVDAVNADAGGQIEIETYFSGALGRLQSQQPQLVLDGTADIAFVIPGQTPERFPDNAIIELPGLFRDMREATLTYTRLLAANKLRGYGDYHVIGAYGSELASIHTRSALNSLDGAQGKKIRVNNVTEGLVLEKLGMVPLVMPVNTISEAISSGAIDGAGVPAAMLFEFGIARVASHHYFLEISSAPLAMLMNRTVFERLPDRARNIIRKYSGEWAAARFIEHRAEVEQQVTEQLKSDPRRKVVLPSAADQERANAAFKAVAAEVVSETGRHHELLATAKAEIARLRTGE